jgi:phasin family protein
MTPPENSMENPTPPFVDVTKLMEQFKLPGIDMQAIVEARRKDIEALTEANRIAFQGMQALAQKQAEILQKSMQEAQAAMHGFAGGQPAASAGNAGDLIQQAFQKALANMRELAEMAGRSQAQAMEVVGKRVQENIEETKKLLQPKP